MITPACMAAFRKGTRVAVCAAPGAPIRYGTVVRVPASGARAGSLYYRVRFDEKANQFEPDDVKVYARAMTPVDPKQRGRYEAGWATAPFIDRSWVAEVEPRS